MGIPKEDPNIRELDCECPLCPSGCTTFTFRVPTAEQDLMYLEPEEHVYSCPRGHRITWEQVRGTCAVDDGGYTIDRSHPLWRRMMGEKEAPPSPNPAAGDCGVCGSLTCNGRCRE